MIGRGSGDCGGNLSLQVALVGGDDGSLSLQVAQGRAEIRDEHGRSNLRS